MSLLDALLLLGAALGAALGACAAMRPRVRAVRWLYPPVAGLLLAAEFTRHGLHWQMVPADALLLVCAVLLALRRPRASRRAARVLAVAGLLGCAASLAMALVLPRFRLPAPTGPFAVGTCTEDWTDPATGRELVVQLWYPAAPVPGNRLARYMRLRETKPIFRYWAALPTNSWQDAPVASARNPAGFPLLLFGHMWGGRRTQDTFLTEDLASHGFVVAAIDHPGNAARVQMANGEVLRSDRAAALDNVEATGYDGIRAVWADELKRWTADNEFVLNALEAGRAPRFAGRLDWLRVGAFGHSFGGSASLALLGLDPRVRAAINLDGWSFEGLDHRTAAQPVLFLYEARDAGLAGGMPSGPGVDDRLERADHLLADRTLALGGGARAYVGGTQHADFTDATLETPLQRLTYTGPIRPARVEAITRGLVLGFFDRTLNGRGNGLPAYPEVRVEGQPPQAAGAPASRP